MAAKCLLLKLFQPQPNSQWQFKQFIDGNEVKNIDLPETTLNSASLRDGSLSFVFVNCTPAFATLNFESRKVCGMAH